MTGGEVGKTYDLIIYSDQKNAWKVLFGTMQFLRIKKFYALVEGCT